MGGGVYPTEDYSNPILMLYTLHAALHPHVQWRKQGCFILESDQQIHVLSTTSTWEIPKVLPGPGLDPRRLVGSCLAYKAFQDLQHDHVIRHAVLKFCQGCLDREAGQHTCTHKPCTMKAVMKTIQWFQYVHGNPPNLWRNRDIACQDGRIPHSRFMLWRVQRILIQKTTTLNTV